MGSKQIPSNTKSDWVKLYCHVWSQQHAKAWKDWENSVDEQWMSSGCPFETNSRQATEVGFYFISACYECAKWVGHTGSWFLFGILCENLWYAHIHKKTPHMCWETKSCPDLGGWREEWVLDMVWSNEKSQATKNCQVSDWARYLLPKSRAC